MKKAIGAMDKSAVTGIKLENDDVTYYHVCDQGFHNI